MLHHRLNSNGHTVLFNDQPLGVEDNLVISNILRISKQEKKIDMNIYDLENYKKSC